MKREVLITIGAVTIAIAGAAGCSSNKSSSPSSTSSAGSTSSSAASSSAAASSSPASASASVSSGAGAATVTIDGQPQNVGGQVVCTTANGKFSIAIGEAITGVIVGMEPDASAVHDVGLGTVNGVVLAYTEGAPGNTATATKDGNHYKITGTATGVDTANPTQQVSKPFEIDVTCP